MNQKSEFQIKTQKQLLDEQIIHEEGGFKFKFFYMNPVLCRSLSRMRSNGWILRGIETRGFLSSYYVFERSSLD